MHSVGPFEAKTHLSELLASVERGEEIVITRRGTPIARLLPIADVSGRAAALEKLGAIRASDTAADGRRVMALARRHGPTAYDSTLSI